MDFIELAKQRERTRKINSITDKVVKGNVLWASENISEGNLIVYAPNASGKTTLSNVIAGNEAHFHSRYVEYIDEDKVPNMVLFSKAKKFSYKDINSYNKIIKDSTRIYSNKFSLEDMVMEINGCLRRYGGSAAFLEKEFLMSLNEENINEAKENFSESLMGWTDRQEYYDLSYGVRPYTYINYNFERSNKHFFNYLKSTKTDPSINGDGAYIKGLISSTDGNKNAINGIYLMILILSQFPDEVSKMTELNMGLLINKRGVAVNKTVYKDELLDKITEQLQSLKIIDSATSVKQIKNKLIIFSKSGRNITRSVFSKISDGQSNLLSLVFFTEMNVLNKEDIIFDDPFDALDRKNSYQVLKTIKRFEKKKKIIILTHDLNSLEMMQTYLAADWEIMFLLNKIKVKLGDVESVDRKFLYAYENNEFQKGIILLMRYLSNDTKLNKFLYGSINKETILSVLKNYYIKHESLESENPGFFNRVLGLYDKLANIKIYFSENYENKKEIKEQIKSGTFNPGDDEFLREYEQLYFVINDLSHNNSWGYNFLEIMSFETEFENLHEAIWKEMVKDL